jgi:hypothetical protein
MRSNGREMRTTGREDVKPRFEERRRCRLGNETPLNEDLQVYGISNLVDVRYNETYRSTIDDGDGLRLRFEVLDHVELDSRTREDLDVR